MKKVCYVFVLLMFVNPVIDRAYAWIYPEHRDMAHQGIKKLSPEKRKNLDELWNLARTGFESRLNPFVIDETNTIPPKFIDFAAWTAIGGNHSVSTKDMLNIERHSDWILSVASIANELKIALAE